MATDPDEQVERLVSEALKHCNFQALEEIILDETRDGRASKCSKQFISKLDRLINRELSRGNVKNASVVFTVIYKMKDMLVFPGGKGISEMVSQGLWFGKLRKIWIEAGPGRSEMMINLAEDFFDVLMVVHESSKEGTYQVTESLLHHIGKLASDAQVNILIQKEAVRKLNVILGKIPAELKKEKKILSSQEISTVMDDLANRILKGGDYDLQVALMEALCRMTSHAQRRELADHWFSMEFVSSAFSNIQDSEFETDCRKFLNLVNGMQGEGRSVYSYPCLEVFLDQHELLMPMDENLKEFWIDFNLGSQSISFYFCLPGNQSQLEGQWETLCIGENEIMSYTVEDEKDMKVLKLVPTEPLCVSNIEGSRLIIHFSSSLDILQVTKKVFGEVKNKKFVGKTSVVKTTVQIILDEGGSQVLFPESQVSSEPTEKALSRSVKNSTPVQSFPCHEKDTQSHNQQIVTPQRSKTSETCMYVSGSSGRKLGRSPFSCVIPATATPVGKAMLKPALEMVAASENKKAIELRDLMLARLSHSALSVNDNKENPAKQAVPPLPSESVPQDNKGHQEAKRYHRHIPVDKALEMVQAAQDLEEEPLDNSMVPDSQPTTRKEISILPGICPAKNSILSVSGSHLPKPNKVSQSEIIASSPLCSELPQQPSSAQNGSGVLSHKQLHAQLTKRLEQVLREQESLAVVQKGNSSVGQHVTEPKGAEKGLASVKGSEKPTPAKPAQTGQARGNTRREMTEKAVDSMVKQISSHYKSAACVREATEMAPQSNFASTKRFNKTWYPALSIKIPAADTCEVLKACNQSKSSSNQKEDIFQFQLEVPVLGGLQKKCRKSSEMSGRESSELSNTLALSSSAKKCPPAKTIDHNAKKHLFSDTDADNMTEVSWLKSENRRPKPKVADYTRQPVKPNLPSADTTYETPNLPLPSKKVVKKMPKPKRKRQKNRVVQKDEKSPNVDRGRPTGRPKRAAVQTKSYREPSGSGSESQTDEPPPAKKQIIKQPKKPQNRETVQTRGPTVKKDQTSSKAAFELTETTESKSKASYNVMKEKTVIPQQLRIKKMLDAMESTKGQKESGFPKMASFYSSTLSTSKMRSDEKGTALPRPHLTTLGALSKTENPQKRAPVEVTPGEEKKDQTSYVGVTERCERVKKQPGEIIGQMDADKTFKEKKEVLKLQSSKRSRSTKTPGNQGSAKEQKEAWTAHLASKRPSPFSIEKMRSAENCAESSRSPITPLRIPPVSPLGALSPPLELPDHLKGIQASSFYKTSGRQNSVRLPLHPPITPADKKHRAAGCLDVELSPVPSLAQPLIASTGKEMIACSSELNSPDLEEDLRGFLNSVSCRSLQASVDKESVISLVTLSQSSHRSVNSIAMLCTNLEKTPEFSQDSKADRAAFQSGPTTHQQNQKQDRLSELSSLSEIEDSEDNEVTKAVPRKLAIKMKPRTLFKPNDKPWKKKKVYKHYMEDQTSSEEEEEEKSAGKRCRPRSVDSQSASPRTTVEDVEMSSTVLSKVSRCWEASVEADIDLPKSEISTSQEMGYVCRQFSTELKRKFENRSKRLDLFTKQSIKAYKHHVSSISVQVHKYRTQKLEKVKGVLMNEIQNLEQDNAALHNLEEELTSFWKKQTLSFHAYRERGTQRLHHLKSAIETNVCHSLDYEKQIFSSEMCLMKKDMKSVQDRLFKQMQEEELLSVRRGLQTLFLPDVSML